MKIDGNLISPVRISPELQRAVEKTGDTGSASFGDVLMEKLEGVQELQNTADEAATDLATGKARNLHEAILAMEMADTSLRFAVTVRNKALEAYQEIMRMPV